MFNKITKYLVKPELYAPSTNTLWDDPHISKGMLEAHLNPHWDAATRNLEFLNKSVDWIAEIAPPLQYPNLLDLGCGPGLYAERFSKAGYKVKGIDFSRRSIAYAKEQAAMNQSNIEYQYKNYLTIDDKEQFDVITLIYCDYAVLSVTDRKALLEKIFQALKPNGKFIFDVFRPVCRKNETSSWEFYENGGFYSEKPHLLLESIYQYDDADQTELAQSIVISDDTVECYHIWDHFFTKDTLFTEIQPVGFRSCEFYNDIAGQDYSESGDTICGVFIK